MMVPGAANSRAAATTRSVIAALVFGLMKSSRMTTSDLLHVDGNRQRLRAGAKDHAAQRRDVGKLPPPAECDELEIRLLAVGRVIVDPAKTGAMRRNPGVRSIGTCHGTLFCGGAIDHITADVA